MSSILYNDKLYGGATTALDADHVLYDNTDSGLTSSNVQDVVDELDEVIESLENPTFTEASTRVNIASGESLATIFGKVKKVITDLEAVAFSGAADDVSYDNTDSGLTATNVQDALDEVASPAAEGVSYDNTTSGLTATDVQDALDEIATDAIPSLVSKVGEVLWLRQAGGSTTYSTGAYTIKVPALHLINVNLNNITVVSQLNPGSYYRIGSINGIVLDGMSEMRVHVNRHNANHAAATLKLHNNDNNDQILLDIEPLETVPSGVGMATTVTFFYKDA